jgi:thiamine biosynthesis lipoprotein
MKRTELIMGMPVTVVIPDREELDRRSQRGAWFPTLDAAAEAVFQSFRDVDERFSPYKEGSETSRIDRGELDPQHASREMREVLELAEDTRRRTDGYFDVRFNGRFDPSGIVKGWAIWKAARLLDDDGFVSFCIEAGGDIEVRGANDEGKPWMVGIRSPFDPSLMVRRLHLHSCGIATSGTYIRGEHIWNPRTGAAASEIASLTVVAANVYEADRFATAAFAMGEEGIRFLAGVPDLDGYMVDAQGTATFTPGFTRYLAA